MKFYVTSNLIHDGKAYRRGDTISLSDDMATHLLLNGVLQTDPIVEEPAPELEPMQEMQPEVAGKAMETGEPSIDGREPERTSDNAEDVTPGIRALSPDVRAEAPEKPKKGKK